MTVALPLAPRSDRFDAAGNCVACGLCLPHCPTYRLSRNEVESPRGRIALMRALAEGQLAASEGALSALNHCLVCRACERACPSQVPFGQLIDAARAELAPSARHAFLYAVLARARARRLFAWLLTLYRGSGMHALLRAITGRWLVRFDSVIRQVAPAPRWQENYPAAGTPHGDVALFTGCASELFERETLTAAITVLNRIGFNVRVPGTQTCCGALYRHGGNHDRAAELATRNLTTFASPETTAIVSCASGCSAMLAEYGQHYADADAFSARFHDITSFLASEWPANVCLRPLRARIAVHDACLLRNALREERAAYTLLARIPGVEIVALAENHICCGAAGSYFLDYPKTAQALGAAKTGHIVAARPDIVVTTNPGCALHLRAGLQAAGLDIEVLHPVALLARQLEA